MWTDYSGNLHLQVTFDTGYATTWDLTGGMHITGDSRDNLYSTAYGDTITGGSGNDYIYANHGNDVLYGAGGNDYLTGGEGADTFVFKGATVFTGTSTIADFNTSDGDKIDISDILEGHYNLGSDNIANFVHIDTSGTDSVLSVDVDGTGGHLQHDPHSYLSGVTGLDVSSLISGDHLIVA